MCKIKYFLFFEKSIHIFFLGSLVFIVSIFKVDFKLMNFNKIKKNSTTEIKENLKKSKFDVLTNENDFLVRNLKKAG